MAAEHETEAQAAEPEATAGQSPSTGHSAPTRASAIRAMQRRGGNAATQQLLRSLAESRTAPAGPGAEAEIEPGEIARAGTANGGAPLARELREPLEPAFGRDLGDVRVHSDGQAAAAADALGARAYALGRDVVFGAGEYQPSSPAGQRLIAHEVAHVTQQDSISPSGPLELSEPGDAAEVEADAAADTALSGGLARLSRRTGPARIARFAQAGTTIKNGVLVGGSGHAFMTESALGGMGLSATEARAGRMGNWERDLSQCLTPTFMPAVMEIMPILNVLAIKEFGRGINIAEFGTYDPVEHIDNPAGLRASDVFDQNAPGTNPADFNTLSNPDTAAGGTFSLNGKQVSREDLAKVGQAERDKRYSAAATPMGANLTNEKTEAFQVDASGIPRYMQTSRLWIKGKLHQSAALGRKGQGGLGPREFSSGIHTMQDYYAHSNFCEIAINSLIRSGGVQLATGDAAHPVLRTADAKQSLDTQMHSKDDPTHNAKVGAEGQREVMTTGTFNTTDTLASLLEEVNDHLKALDPFKKDSKEASELAAAALDYLEMDPKRSDNFNGTGKVIGQLIRGLDDVITPIPTGVAAVAEGAGKVAGAEVKGVGSVVSSGLGLLGLDDAAKKVSDATSTAASDISGAAGVPAEAVKALTEMLHQEASSMENEQHLLRRAYTWLHDTTPLRLAKAAARRIPVVGEKIAKAIEAVEEEIRKLLEKTLGALWNGAIDAATEKIDGIIHSVKGYSNVKEQSKQSGEGVKGKLGGLADMYEDGEPKAGIAPSTFEPPSHTQIAKDHDDAPGAVPDGDDHHDHVSNYLAPLAVALAKNASNAIGKQVALAWDKADAGTAPGEAELKAIDAAVDLYFSHPDDCKPTWTDEVTRELKSTRLGAEVAQRLGSH